MNFNDTSLTGLGELGELGELGRLLKENPDELARQLRANPEILAQLADLNENYKSAERVSVEGFERFYKKIYNRELPAVQKPIVRGFVEAYEGRKGVMEECWRGFGKSTLLIAWVAYLIGARPVGSTALVRINDDKSKQAGKSIAELIDTNPGWKEIFPHVVPDKEAGWSAEAGYHVKDMRVCKDGSGYAEWLRMCFADHVAEPSLSCGGIESGNIIGMHPTNGMWFDDLLDEDNTRSVAEMQRVIDLFDGNIIGTWFSVSGSPTLGVACTPWRDNDVYARMMDTGLFTKISIPIFVRENAIPQGHPAEGLWRENLARYGAQVFEPYDASVILTWPEAFPMEKVLEIYNAGPARFGQMYLLDLETLKGLTLKKEWLREYPAEQIKDTWPVVVGVDFASTTDKLNGKTDYFTVAIGRVLPQGGVVLTGGFRGRLPMQEGIRKLQGINSVYHPEVIAVEKLGGGRQFLEALQQHNLPIVPFPIQGTALKSKGQKFENVLATAFTQGRLWVSSVRDDFLNAFYDEWISWDGGAQRSRTGHDDTLDAVYIMAEAARGQIMAVAIAGDEPAKPKSKHPLDNIGELMYAR